MKLPPTLVASPSSRESGVPHPHEAVLEMRRQKLSLRQIALFLTKIGAPTKQRGVSWHPQMVKRLLAALENQEPKI